MKELRINKQKGFTPLEFLKNFIGAKKNDQKTLTGFTLIELLVVIAIIGILASIVMVSLNSARNKGADTAVKANLKAIMTQAELVYDTNNSYATVCADATVVKALQSAASASGGATVCNNQATLWAASSALKSDGYWCVDSAGNNKPETATLGTGVYVCQ